MYKELNSWKSAQTGRVKEDVKLSDGEKHKVFRSILNTEIEMLQTLDKQFLYSNKVIRKKCTDSFLETLGNPKKWRNSDGRNNLVTTAYTIRAAELFEIYRKLQENVFQVVE